MNIPLVACENKGPPRHLMTLFSEESGFGENSLSESYSDGDWEDEYGPEREEEEEGCDVKGSPYWRESETWKQFVEQALSCSPSISPRCCICLSRRSSIPVASTFTWYATLARL